MQRNSNLLIGFQQNWVRFVPPCFIRCFILLFISTDIPVILPPEDELVFTDRHLGQGLQASETELPNESASKQGESIFFLLEAYLFHLLQVIVAVRSPTQNKSLCLPTWALLVLRRGKPFAKLYVKLSWVFKWLFFFLVMMMILTTPIRIVRKRRTCCRMVI